MRNLILAVSASAMAIPATFAVPIDSAQAQRGYYDRDGNYRGPTWRDNRGRYRCRRSDGTTGLIVGGAAGALVGRAVDNHGDRATGTIIGAVVGGAAGAAVAVETANRAVVVVAGTPMVVTLNGPLTVAVR